MIHYFVPFDPAKRLGWIHNQYCKLITNPEDWICILDPDTCFLHPHQQAWIENIVCEYGDDWDLLGCMTNNIGIEEQRQRHFHVSKMVDCKIIDLIEEEDYVSDITDIKNHMAAAEHLHNYYSQSFNDGTVIYPIKETFLIAGFFMLFKRSLWDKIKFEYGIDFDIKFCNMVKRFGGRIGIIKSIYIWHTYRLWSDNPKKEKKHLL